MKIAIAGYGIEGQTSYNYYASDPVNEITIVDQVYPASGVPKGVRTITGEDAFSNLIGFDLVVRTPALSPKNIKTDGKIWSATNEFFAKCPAPIIGVTGTKGKGTTASLIASVLRQSGKKVWLVGNIGIASLEVLPDVAPEDIVIYELSSFQLWDIEFSPHIAVMLFVEPEHLNVHNGAADYFAAKLNITKYQTANDTLVYYAHNKHIDVTASANAKLVPYPSTEFAHVKDDKFYYGETELGAISELKLLGKHNLDNACAAIDAIWQYVSTPDVIMAGLAAFSGLPHRLKLVGVVNEVSYYDDSIATSPSATIAALNAIDGPKHLILGGSSKGLDYSELAARMLEGDVLTATLVGAEADKIADTLESSGFYEYTIIESDKTLAEIVTQIHAKAGEGSAVLLSPAASSRGMFKNYVDRGNQFIQAVEGL